MENGTRVKVAVRVRPINEYCDGLGASPCVLADEELACVGLGDRRFTFDYVFGVSSKQDDVYNACVAPLVESCFEGYNGTVFAYGQTGSGKTHTMGMGSAAPPTGSAQEGIAPRVVRQIFDRIDAISKVQPTARVVVTASFLEIHNEELRDLLALPGTPPKALAIRECNDGSLVVTGAREVQARSTKDLTKLLQESATARATSSTLMNEASSRSHVVASIAITQHTSMQPSENGGYEAYASGVQVVTKAKLHLVDLAGSERVKRSGVADSQPDIAYRGAIGSVPNGAMTARFKEAININQGLLALGSVISALGDEKKKGSHVPYRDSRLTRLLQDSLGGNSRTAMIACVSSADNSLEESLNTLKWAHRARNISNRPEANRSAEGASKQAALVSMQAEVGMMALSLARRTAELVPMYAGHGATMLLNQVLGAVDPGSVSSIAMCARTLDCLGALQLRLLHNQEDWHGGEQPQTKLYSINQAVMAGSSSKGLRSHPVGNQSMFEDDTASMAGTEDGHHVDGQSPNREDGRGLLTDSDTEGGDSVGRGQVAQLKAALKTARQELCTTVNALKETRDDLERDEMIFADQQRELIRLRMELAEARGGNGMAGNRAGTLDGDTDTSMSPFLLQPQLSTTVEPGDDGICWTTNASQLANAPITGRVPLGSLGSRGQLDSCQGFNRGGQHDEGAGDGSLLVEDYGSVPLGKSESPDSPDKSNLDSGPSCNDWSELSGGEEAEAGGRRVRRTDGSSLKWGNSETELLHHRESQLSTESRAAEVQLAAELAAAAAEKAALEADKAALEAAVQKQQEDFEMVRNALESRMTTLCESISQQEAVIAELQAEEQRAKEANNALNERLAALEAEITSREEEAAILRTQLAGMEGEMKAKQEARIYKTQAQVSMLRRQVVDVEATRGAERDRQRNASKAASVQAELKSMKMEQEALRRRLADRTAVNERSAKQHAQEAAALKRAADAARTRISQLESENRQQRLQLKRKAEEIVLAENRLKAKTNEHLRMSVSHSQSLRRSATFGGPQGASPRMRMTPSASTRYPGTLQPAPSSTPRSTPLTASASARQPSIYLMRSSSTRIPPSPRSSLQQPSPRTGIKPQLSARHPSPSPRTQPRGPFSRPPQTPRASGGLQHASTMRKSMQPAQTSPHGLSRSQSLKSPRQGREQHSFYPSHPTVGSCLKKDSGSPRPSSVTPSSPATPTRTSWSGTEPNPPTADSQASTLPTASAASRAGLQSVAYSMQPELDEWLQEQVQVIADRASRDAKAVRMQARHSELRVRRQALLEQRARQAQQAQQAVEEEAEGKSSVDDADRQQQELVDLDDQLDGCEEEMNYLEGELSQAEHMALRGQQRRELELRRRIASLPALSIRGALQSALQVLVEYQVRHRKQAQQQQQQQQQQQDEAEKISRQQCTEQQQQREEEGRDSTPALEEASGEQSLELDRACQGSQGKAGVQPQLPALVKGEAQEQGQQQQTKEQDSIARQAELLKQQHLAAVEEAVKQQRLLKQQQEQQEAEEGRAMMQQQQEQPVLDDPSKTLPTSQSFRSTIGQVPGPGNSPAVRASRDALAAAISGYKSLRSSASIRSSATGEYGSNGVSTRTSISREVDLMSRQSEPGFLGRAPLKGIGSRGEAVQFSARVHVPGLPPAMVSSQHKAPPSQIAAEAVKGKGKHAVASKGLANNSDDDEEGNNGHGSPSSGSSIGNSTGNYSTVEDTGLAAPM